MSTQRYKIVIQYDGSRFHGSQIQPRFHTVSGDIQSALKQIGIDGSHHLSGRTDTGVHASGQVMHIDLPPHWQNLERFKAYLSQMLLPHITIRTISPVAPDFHARHSAIRRQYRYFLSTQTPSPFQTPYLAFVNSFDPVRVREAARLFEGTHDFALFMKTGSDIPHSVRTIFTTKVYQYKGLYVCVFEGNGFLRSQIRMMMGFLLEISEGRLTQKALLEQLKGVHQHNTLPAPPNGLYLSRVFYKNF